MMLYLDSGGLPARVNRIPIEEARTLLEKVLPVQPPELVPTASAVGRILVEDFVAQKPFPPFDVSHIDGFAVRTYDLRGASPDSPVTLKVKGASRPAGALPRRIGRGECIRVFTGAPLPPGADAVVMQEKVKAEGQVATFVGGERPLTNIYRAGDDVKPGALLLARGHSLTARDVSFLLTYGVRELKVARALRVSVLATGSELVEEPEQLGEGKTLESNRIVLKELLRELGFVPADAGVAPDEVGPLASAMNDALQGSDALLTTGGSSVSEADLVPDAVASLGGSVVFHGLLLKPSRTVGVAIVRGKPVFLLSGLIQASISALYNVVLPSLRHVQGLGWRGLSSVKARVTEDVAASDVPQIRRVIWVSLTSEGAILRASPIRASSPSRIVITRANAFIVTGPGQALKKGDLVDVRLPPGFGLEASLGK